MIINFFVTLFEIFHFHFLFRERYGLSIYASRLLFVSCYIVASLYGLVWDVVMDWGLMPDPDNFIRSAILIILLSLKIFNVNLYIRTV